MKELQYDLCKTLRKLLAEPEFDSSVFLTFNSYIIITHSAIFSFKKKTIFLFNFFPIFLNLF